jgi:hypothetical protein
LQIHQLDLDYLVERTMKRSGSVAALIAALVLLLVIAARATTSARQFDGQQIFRFETFGDEQLWTTTLRLQEAIVKLTPADALGAGLKVDVQALPAAVASALKAGTVPLDDPSVTLQLLSLNAVVGVIGKVNGTTLESVGITCALCHSTVDNSLTTGIGNRLDGWPARDLNVGKIIALSPALTDDQRKVFNSWGPGKYDPRLQAFDGTGFISLNPTSFPVLIPPAYGLQRLGFETVTGDGPISYWNNYVGVTQMGGHGNFKDPNLSLDITQAPDLVTPRLSALRDYQLRLRAPEPPRGSFDRAAARRGEEVFSGIAGCKSCHTPPAFSDVLSGPAVPLLHAPSETGMESEYARRSVTKMYRTAPLHGIWQHPPYFHDGSAADLLAVVNHYDRVRSLGLTAQQKRDLVEFLKSL